MFCTSTDSYWQMRSSAFRCLVDVSGLCRSSSLASEFILPYNAASISILLDVHSKRRLLLARCVTSSVVLSGIPQFTQLRGYSATKNNVPLIPDSSISTGGPARWPRNPTKWIALLEPYLPPHLRNESGHGETRNVHTIRDVAITLSKARESFYGGLDLLSYLGVCQKRWKAVIWLVKAMSSSYSEHSKAKEELEKLRAPQWKYGLDLETLTDSAIWADDLVRPVSDKVSLESLYDQNAMLMDGRTIKADRDVIGQIWQSAACMIIQAADHPPGDSTSKIIMSHVLEILAHLHHIDAFPHSIYHYNPPADTSVPHKSPTLALLSSQIMTILADTAWRAREDEIWPEERSYETSGDDRARNRERWVTGVKFHVPELSHGIWLDLILWSCVEKGWISEAAWIVQVINKRKHDPDRRWSVIGWDSINHHEAPKMGWNTRLNNDFRRLSVHHLSGGFSEAGEGGKPVSINIPPRTLSREVIQVLIDGIISDSPNSKKKREYRIRSIQESISKCIDLLETEGQRTDHQIIDSTILRLLDLDGSATTRTPELLEQVLRFLPEEFRVFIPPQWVSASDEKNTPPDSTISLGLIHQMLYCFARVDLVHGTLRSFKLTQDVVDVCSQQRLKEFITKELQPLQMDEQVSFEKITMKSEVRPLSLFHLPGHVLVAFLEFIIRAELWDLGKWLFYSNDADGPLITAKLYSDSRLQPVFLRFATATADAQLLIRVTERLKAPLSQSILRALLHCQVAVGRWSAVQDLLTYFRDEPGMNWDASDAMSIATSILRMERSMSKPDFLNSGDVSLAFDILQKLISGGFNTVHRGSLGSDFTQFRVMIQIGRILRRIPGKLSTLKSKYFGSTERFCAPVSISVEAFNLLIKCIVDCRGSFAGKELWDMWCRDVGQSPQKHDAHYVTDPELERVIYPDLQTLRIVLQPIIRACISNSHINVQAGSTVTGDDISTTLETKTPISPQSSHIDILSTGLVKASLLSQSEHQVLQWGITTYRKFGLTEEDLKAELTGHLSPPQIIVKSAAVI